jgi:hypothetical protein
MIHLAMTGLMARRLTDENAISGLDRHHRQNSLLRDKTSDEKCPPRPRKVGRALPASDVGGAVRGRIGSPFRLVGSADDR